MGASSQLKLVQMQTPEEAAKQSTDPVRRVFDHWLFMFGRSANRCKLGPTRAAAINAALVLYDEDQLMAAIEGMAADPLADCASEKMRDAMREIEWILGREARVERWADRGDALRIQALRQAKADATPAPTDSPAPIDPAAAQAARLHLRKLAARARGVADE